MPEKSYWELLHSGSDSGWDTMDNNYEQTLKHINKLLKTAGELDGSNGQIVTFELFQEIIEADKYSISQDDENSWKLYNQLLNQLELALLDGFKYLDDWNELKDKQESIAHFKIIYKAWSSQITAHTSNKVDLKTIQESNLEGVNYYIKTKAITDHTAIVDSIINSDFESVINSMKGQSEHKTRPVSLIILQLFLESKLPSTERNIKIVSDYLTERNLNIPNWKLYLQYLEERAKETDRATKLEIGLKSISITGKFGADRSTLEKYISNSNYTYNRNKKLAKFVLIGRKPSITADQLSSGQNAINFVEFLELVLPIDLKLVG